MLPSRSRASRFIDPTFPRWTIPAQLLSRLRPGLRPVIPDDIALVGRVPLGRLLPWLVPVVMLLLAFLRPTSFAAMRYGEHYINNPLYVFTTNGFLPFTDSLALMLVPLVLGLLVPSLGVLFVVSYCLLDLILSIHVPFAALAARFIEYWLIWLLVVEVPLASRGVLHAIRARQGNSAARTLIGAGAGAALAGVLVYIWVQAMPLLIRPFFTWGRLNGVPTVESVVVLQTQGNLLMTAGVIATLLSVALLGWAGRLEAQEDVVFGLASRAPAAARTGLPGLRWVRPVVVAVLLVAALGGMITTLSDALLLLGAMLAGWGLGWLVRRVPPLSRTLAAIPLVLRFVLGFALSYAIALQLTATPGALMTRLAPLASTFLPVVLATAVSLLLFGVLLYGAAPQRPRRSSQRRGGKPGRLGASGAPLLLILLGLAGVVWLVTAPAAHADNCSGFSDCFNSAAAAAAAAAAAGAAAVAAWFTGGQNSPPVELPPVELPPIWGPEPWMPFGPQDPPDFLPPGPPPAPWNPQPAPPAPVDPNGRPDLNNPIAQTTSSAADGIRG